MLGNKLKRTHKKIRTLMEWRQTAVLKILHRRRFKYFYGLPGFFFFFFRVSEVLEFIALVLTIAEIHVCFEHCLRLRTQIAYASSCEHGGTGCVVCGFYFFFFF